MRMERAFLIGGLLLVGVLSGCIGWDDPDDDFSPRPVEPPYEDVTRHTKMSFDFDVETGLHLLERELVGEAAMGIPERASNLTLELSRSWGLNELTLELEDPDGNIRTHDPADGEWALDAPEEGEYTVYLYTQGVAMEDTVEIEVAYDWIQRVYRVGGADPVPEEGITLERQGDEWVARLVSTASGSADEFDIKTSSGVVNVDRGGDTAQSTVSVTARAADRDLAREALDHAVVTNQVQSGLLKSHATWEQNSHDDRVQRGIEIDVVLPQDTSGSVETSSGNSKIQALRFGSLEVEASSGNIDLQDVVADSLDADASSGNIDIDATVGTLRLGTSSGNINGQVTTGGDVTLDASSGSITLTISPTESLALDAETSSGSITLSLEEDSDIAYDLELKVSSGSMQESMDEAELEYPDPEDDDHAFLRTTDGDGRSIQVTGNVKSSSGSQSYRSA